MAITLKSIPINLITLRETPEREIKAIKELSKYPFEIITHKFDRNPIGWKGCIDSHLKIFEKSDSDILWIAEDNLVCSGNLNYKNLEKFLNTCDDWDIIFVGGYILRPWDYCRKTKYDSIYETRNNNHGTISYIINKKLYKDIVKLHTLKPIDIHYDIYLSKFKCYIYNPLLFYHSHNIKSNINSHSDVWRKVWFHPLTMKVLSIIFFNQKTVFICILLILIFKYFKKY